MNAIPQVPPFANEVFVTFENVDPMDVRKILQAVQGIGLPHSISVESKLKEFDNEAPIEDGSTSLGSFIDQYQLDKVKQVNKLCPGAGDGNGCTQTNGHRGGCTPDLKPPTVPYLDN